MMTLNFKTLHNHLFSVGEIVHITQKFIKYVTIIMYLLLSGPSLVIREEAPDRRVHCCQAAEPAAYDYDEDQEFDQTDRGWQQERSNKRPQSEYKIMINIILPIQLIRWWI